MFYFPVLAKSFTSLSSILFVRNSNASILHWENNSCILFPGRFVPGSLSWPFLHDAQLCWIEHEKVFTGISDQSCAALGARTQQVKVLCTKYLVLLRTPKTQIFLTHPYLSYSYSRQQLDFEGLKFFMMTASSDNSIQILLNSNFRQLLWNITISNAAPMIKSLPLFPKLSEISAPNFSVNLWRSWKNPFGMSQIYFLVIKNDLLKIENCYCKKKHSQVLSIFFLKIFAKACRIYKAHWKDENINRLKGSHKVYRPRPRLASIEQARKHFEGKASFFFQKS